MSFHVYILKCADDSYSTGHTDQLEARIAMHQSGKIAGYTSTRLPVKVVYTADFPTRLEALASVRQIKGWSRAKQEAMMRGDWQRVSELAKNRQSDG